MSFYFFCLFTILMLSGNWMIVDTLSRPLCVWVSMCVSMLLPRHNWFFFFILPLCFHILYERFVYSFGKFLFDLVLVSNGLPLTALSLGCLSWKFAMLGFWVLYLVSMELVFLKIYLWLSRVSAYLCIKYGEKIKLIEVQTSLSPYQEVSHKILG